MKKTIWIIPIILTAACGSKTNKTETAAIDTAGNIIQFTAGQLKTAGIEAKVCTPGRLTLKIPVNGVVDVPPQNLVSLSFPFGGYLKYTQLIPGMRVSKGQAIATMEDVQYIQLQQDYLLSTNKLQETELEYNRQKQLYEGHATSEKIYQQTQADLNRKKIEVAALAEKLRLLGLNPGSLSSATISRTVQVYSPINGYVSKVHINAGKYVNPSDVLFELVNPDDYHLALKVFEKDLSHLSIGQSVKAWVSATPQDTHSAKIILISQDLDEDRSAMVHCHFDKTDHKLLPGMFMEAELQLAGVDALSVPAHAVVQTGKDRGVFVQTGSGAFRFEPVQVLSETPELVYFLFHKPGVESLPVVYKNAWSVLGKWKNNGEEQ
ncbi:MAG: efflux RND transporter periplasmic adaptor subunit [Bacteroidetes bacterium]|nr:efflux RND transporter periplasmic adaptor subunit [Bacteroidota bacterium]